MLSLRSGWSRTTCDFYGAAVCRSLGSNATMSEDDGRTIGPKIRISRRGDGSEICSGSRARVQLRDFFPYTPPPTTPCNVQRHLTLPQLHRVPRAAAMSTWREVVA